jgi:MFS family permease
MMLGMFILTIGEILTFPTSSLFIDRLAPEPLRGTYFGANGFRNIGFFLGPALGGWLLGSYGGKVAFGLIALLTVCGVLFYWMGYRAWLQRKNAPEKESVSNTSLSAAKAVR